MAQLLPSPGQTDCTSRDDEIDLFMLAETLWAHKFFIGLTTFVFALAGLAYSSYKPSQPDTYTAKAVLEVGSYAISTGQIFSLELGGDLVQIINQVTRAKARLLRGSASLIQIEVTHAQSEKANESLGQAVDFVVKRHQAVSRQIGVDRLIRPTSMIGVVQLQKHSLSEKKALIIAGSVLLGLALSVMLVLLRKFYIQHTQRAVERMAK